MSLIFALAGEEVEGPPRGLFSPFPQEFVVYRGGMRSHLRFLPRREKKCSRREIPGYRDPLNLL